MKVLARMRCLSPGHWKAGERVRDSLNLLFDESNYGVVPSGTYSVNHGFFNPTTWKVHKVKKV